MSVGSKQEQWHICVSPTREQRTISPIAKPARVELPRLEAKKQTNENQKQTNNHRQQNKQSVWLPPQKILPNIVKLPARVEHLGLRLFILRNTNVHPEKYFTWHLNTNWIWCHVAQKSTQFKAFRQRTKSQESAPILGALYQGKDCTKYCTQYQYLVPFNIDFVPGTYVVPVYLVNTF